MHVKKLTDMWRGWLIGDFEPSVLRTKDFEVGVLTHPAGEVWPAHYHKGGTEYNVLLEGKMNVCDTMLEAGDIFIIEPYEIAEPTFYTDCRILCIKVPSDTNDKFLVGEE